MRSAARVLRGPDHRGPIRRGSALAAVLGVLPIALAVHVPSATAATSTPTRAPSAPSTATPIRAAASSQGSVQVHIDDVSPSVVPRSTTPQPLRIRVSLTNTSDSAIPDVLVLGYRGDPIGNQKALDSAIAQQSVPSDGYPVRTTTPVRVDLPAHGTVTSIFATTISILNDDRGLCQCHDAIYPLYLVASVQGANGRSTLGSAATYVPSQVQSSSTRVKVSWVWPLIDRPHRLESDTTFFDDDLSASVSGGRLDRALQVVEGLNAATPVTLVVDPELLDELEVMATGKYTVVPADGSATAVAGTGAAAAQAWLARFGAVVNRDNVQVALTPYADPDVQALTDAGLSWASKLPADIATRVSAALAGRPAGTDVAWPAGGAVDSRTLTALAASGIRTAVVDSSALSPATSNGVPVATARLRTSSGVVAAAAMSPAMQRQVAAAVEPAQSSTSGANVLPYLIAEVAIRGIQNDNDNGANSADTSAVLAPPRYVDADPARAIRTIEDTSRNAYATPVLLRSLSDELPSAVSRLRATGTASPKVGLPTSDVAAAARISRALPVLSSLIGGDKDAQPLIVGLGRAQQRIASSAWRQTTRSPFDWSVGPSLAADVHKQLTNLLGGVRIVTPDSASYTLGSDDSSLPITVENTLPYTVEVKVAIAAQDGLPGYSMRDVGAHPIAANGKQTVQVPSHLERSGRIRVDARLTTPTGHHLGRPVLLYVRSTELGTIGVVITAVAGGVLALALLVRVGRRLQRRRRDSRRAGADDRPASRGRGSSARGVQTGSP